MNWTDRLAIARVRTAALSAMVAAGGDPRPGQVQHAIAPLLVDVDASPSTPPAVPATSTRARRRRVRRATKL